MVLNDQLSLHFSTLQQLIKQIEAAFGLTLTSKGELYGLEPRYTTDEYQKRYYALAKNLFEVINRINAAQIALRESGSSDRQEELDIILNTRIILARHANNYGGTVSLHGDKAIAEYFERNGVSITAKDALNTVIPKTMILMQLNNLLVPAQKKLETLKTQDRENEITFAANSIINAALSAKQTIIDTNNIYVALTTLENNISDIYSQHEKTLSTHRGYHNGDKYPILNIILDLLRGLRGIIVGILTSPGWLYDPKGMKTFIGSYFERPKTQSLKIFGAFKDNTTIRAMTESIGMQPERPVQNF